MSSKYSTIQQHEPLTPPRSWDTEERRLLVRLEEILDDIYRRFGRLRIEDFNPKVRDKISSIESLDDRVTVAEGEISNLGDEIVLKVSKGTYGPGTISEGSTAPEDPVSGDLWYNTSVSPSVVMKYNGAVWEPVAAEEVHTSGIDIESNRVEITTENFSVQITDEGSQTQQLSVDKDGVFADTLSGNDIEGLPAARRYTGGSFTTNDMNVISSRLNMRQLTEDITVSITDTQVSSSLILKGITGTGKLTIEGAGSTTPTEVFGGITVDACLARIEFKYIPASYTVADSPFVKFTDCAGGSSGTQTVTVTDQVIQAHTTASWYTPAYGWAASRTTAHAGYRTNGRTYAALAWFDLSGIPANAVFTAAKLRFYRTGTAIAGSRYLTGNTTPCTGPDQSFSFSQLTATGNSGHGSLNDWTEITESPSICETLRTGAYGIYHSGTSTYYMAELSGSAGDHPPELVVSYQYETSGSALDVTYTDHGLADYLRGIGAIT